MDKKQKNVGRGSHMVEMMRKRSVRHASGDHRDQGASTSEPSTSYGGPSTSAGPSGDEPRRKVAGRGGAGRPDYPEREQGTSRDPKGEAVGKGRGQFLSQLAKQSKLKSSTQPVGTREAFPQSYQRRPEEGVVESKFSELSVEPEAPPVIKLGETGQKVKVYTNYITLTTDPGKGVFEFEVRFEPTIDFIAFRYQLVNQHFQIRKGIKCYDGGDKLYMPEKITETEIHLQAVHPQDESPVIITIIFKRQMRLRECSQLYNVLFNNCAKVLDLTRLGRHHYDHRANRFIPQHKLEVWPGYVTSVEEFEGGIHLCCDIKHRVLRTETAYDILANTLKTDPNNFRNRAVRELLGQCILTRYNNHMYRIDDIAWDQTPASTFSAKGTTISYIEYYKRQYNINIRDINQPLLIHLPKRRGPISQICLIPELSHMTGLTDQMRKDMKVMKEVATYTRITPSQRQFGLKKFLENICNNTRAQDMLREWGLKISPEPLCIDARILPIEEVFFKNNQRCANYDSAEWLKFLRKQGVLRSVDITNWIFLYASKDRKLAEMFVLRIQEIGPSLGIHISEPQTVCLRDDRIETYIKGLKDCIKPNTQIVVCLCSTPREDRYSAIKKLCCRDLPIPSQVINCGTIARENRMRAVVQNVALQMNNKLGGASWAVTVPLKNCMICGIDTYHDADKRSNSVGAFVASIDSRYTKWFSRACLQEPKQELLDGLVACFTSALKKYLSVNKVLPDRIVIFRDGVGDGQLPIVQQIEIQQFLDACKLVSEKYKPKFSFVVVQKRINTKYFLSGGGPDILENPRPGCILDHTITRRNLYDFFLVSQHVSCGTATPSHYIVLYDNSDLKPDHMQRLTYKFCHMYYNWPGTIRVPAPCQYAHKLAFLVGQNIKGSPNDLLEDKLFYL